MKTDLLSTSSPTELAQAVERAVELLAAGEVVALPTETVYGLAADALRAEAAVKIFEAKERPLFDPLIIHLPDREWLERLTLIPEESRALVEALIKKFWPGPLTVVLPRRAVVPDLVTAGLETVAVRMSAHPVFRAIITAFGKPLAAPSANRFGRISPTTAAHVQSELGGRIPLIVDGGATEHGLESTIVRVRGTEPQVLRAGPVTGEELAGVWAEWAKTRDGLPDRACWMPREPLSRIEAPGQMKSHYAPRTPLRLAELSTFNVQLPTSKVGLLAFTSGEYAGEFAAMEILSPSGDLREAAATLFAKLRCLDAAGLDLIVAEPVPERGLGIAIMDRLRKAAAHE